MDRCNWENYGIGYMWFALSAVLPLAMHGKADVRVLLRRDFYAEYALGCCARELFQKQ